MLLNRIKESENLSDRESKIADYVLANASQIVHMTINQFALGAGVSKASVVRFCQHFGIKGFKDFKIRLTQEMSSEDGFRFNLVQKEHIGQLTLAESFYNATALDRQAVDGLTETLDLKQVQAAIDVVKDSTAIAVFGVGASLIVAEDLTHKLTKLRLHVRTHADFHYMLSIILSMSPGDPLILISTSGETEEIIQLTEFAKTQGITVIAITTLQKSSLTKLADIVLSTPVLEDVFRVGNMGTRISQLAVVDTLFMGLYETIGDKVVDEFYELRNAVMKYKRSNKH
ncbi:MurR/RpiR family transcriptional regulator [Lacticaseibacillus daqingensis]|uniref:MurR/RpiR family transcriptional regulator n=1 Tax=Lacticaseibacillus daqingensis TaxID=2486014 RepID=UPI000F788866|nr:MurR/RpiR family transcriptional regulator [Lacticaseibacillus daqingensis]